MKLQFKSEYNSIKYFEAVEIPKLTVLIGVNGSGKTHLLEAIKLGHVEIVNIQNSEIVYYNYNDFTIQNNNQSQIIGNREYEWIRAKESFQYKIGEIRNLVTTIVLQGKSNLDSYLLSLLRQSNSNLETFLDNDHDSNSLQSLQNKNSHINIDGISKFKPLFTSEFYSFLYSYLDYTKGYIDEINLVQIKRRLTELHREFEDTFKQHDEELYRFLKGSVQKSILAISLDDFESPNFILENIAKEELDYQYRRANNSFNMLRAKEWNEAITYLNKDEYLKKFGLSPVEQINTVLNKYDCNGYQLVTSELSIQLGISKEQMNLQISLKNDDIGYNTTFEKLSSGEKTLIALSLLLYKSNKSKIIPRVLLLDEVDSSLHPSMIKRLLKVINEIFVGIKGLSVILVTHSPTTVALSSEESIFLVTKNSENKINKIDRASAVNLLTEGFATLNGEDASLGIGYNISKTNLPILLTEGITDKIIIETAWKKLHVNIPMPFYIQDCFDATFLRNLLNRGHDPQDGIFSTYPDRIFMALFDFDYEGYSNWNNLKSLTEVCDDPTQIFCKNNIDKNIYAFLLPIPDNEDIKRQVIKKGNQTFKHESSLQVEHLFYGISSLEQYFGREPVVGGGEKIVFKGDKRKFAKMLSNLDSSDFKSFIPLFKKIKEVIKS